jgi:hypothetical protein
MPTCSTGAVYRTGNEDLLTALASVSSLAPVTSYCEVANAVLTTTTKIEGVVGLRVQFDLGSSGSPTQLKEMR